jgi:hypothetical protein
MVILPSTTKNNVISVPVPADAIRYDFDYSSSASPLQPADPSPSPPPLPAPPEEISPPSPLTPTQHLTPTRPSEAPTEDLSLLLAPDVTMNHASPPPPDSMPEPAANLFTQPTQLRRPLAVSLSEGDIFNSNPQHNNSSIRARVEENAAMRSLEPNGFRGNALNKYTKSTMPPIHDAFPTALYEHVDLQLLDIWERCADEKLLIQPFDKPPVETQALNDLRSAILTAIKEITKAEHLAVSASTPRGKQPCITFLIYNLGKEHKKILLDRYVWSSSAVTFRVSPTDPPCPDFLFAINNLGTMIVDDVLQIVQNVWHDETTEAFLNSLVNSAPLPDSRKMATSLPKFINSLSVARLDAKGRGDTLQPRFNIYAEGSIIGDDKTWTQVRSFLANRTYATQLLGLGTIKVSPFHCTLCHGVDHPRGLCPFPDIVGWNGPSNQNMSRNVRGPF